MDLQYTTISNNLDLRLVSWKPPYALNCACLAWNHNTVSCMTNCMRLYPMWFLWRRFEYKPVHSLQHGITAHMLHPIKEWSRDKRFNTAPINIHGGNIAGRNRLERREGTSAHGTWWSIVMRRKNDLDEACMCLCLWVYGKYDSHRTMILSLFTGNRFP